jgi:hypothetical protein
MLVTMETYYKMVTDLVGIDAEFKSRLTRTDINLTTIAPKYRKLMLTLRRYESFIIFILFYFILNIKFKCNKKVINEMISMKF